FLYTVVLLRDLINTVYSYRSSSPALSRSLAAAKPALMHFPGCGTVCTSPDEVFSEMWLLVYNVFSVDFSSKSHIGYFLHLL
ncbi:hypothetical protein, partial [Klebsiella pneumoniae]|uniref:hypothetical protein n=1 Tax=Klebsiella pneumoniae TaxID=573 RepID=UPI001D0D6D0E